MVIKSEKCCYKCKMNERIFDKRTGCGIGRIMKPLHIHNGLYKLYFLSHMRKEFRDAVKKSISEQNVADSSSIQPKEQKIASQMIIENPGENHFEIAFQTMILASCQIVLILVLGGTLSELA